MEWLILLSVDIFSLFLGVGLYRLLFFFVLLFFLLCFSGFELQIMQGLTLLKLFFLRGVFYF